MKFDMVWWTNLTPQKKITSGLAFILITVSSSLSGVIVYLNRKIDRNAAIYKQDLLRKDVKIDSLNNQNLSYVLKNESMIREKLEYYENKERYKDSINDIIQLANSKLDKAISNAKKIQ